MKKKNSATVPAPSFKHSGDLALFGSPDLGGWGRRTTHPSLRSLQSPKYNPENRRSPARQPRDDPACRHTLRTPELPGAYLRSRHCSRPLPVYRPASSSGCYRIRGRDPTHPPPDSRSALRVAQRSCQPRKAKQMIAKPRFCV